MKQQIASRLGVAHVRDTMMQFVTGAITRQQAMESLQVGQSQLYALRTSYLAARAEGLGDTWAPGSSGGNHMPAWPEAVQRFLRRVLGAKAVSKAKKQNLGPAGAAITAKIMGMVGTLLYLPITIIMLAITIPALCVYSNANQKDACISNLKQIQAAVEQAKMLGISNPDWSDLIGNDKYIKSMPECPSGGTYIPGNDDEEPSCSVEGHRLGYYDE